ncbi:MAG: TonB-dependent receptor family protein [Flavobacteriales bacterium]
MEFTHMDLLRHQPGGLTDRAFQKDPSISLRERNWFRVRWNLGAIRFKHRFSSRSKLESRFFGLMGSRDAIGILTRIDRADHGGERLLLKDEYRNFGNETRYLQRYELGGKNSVFLLGGRYYQGHTLRQQGKGSDGKGPDFKFRSKSRYRSIFRFPSRNLALFAENVFRVGDRWTLTPGLRFEGIRTASKGRYHQVNRDLAGNIIHEETIHEERANQRSFLLYGMGVGFSLSPDNELYANYSTNYRGIGFNDMRIINPNFKVDPNLQDESGYSADLGFRGKLFGLLRTDISLFTLYYADRIGSVLQVDSSNFQTFRLRTNVADSRTYGVESYVELEVGKLFQKEASWTLRPFLNLTWQQASYIDSKEPAFEGNRVEMAPEWSLISGVKGSYKRWEWRYQFQYISHQYADATNARYLPSAELGLIPAYSVSDLSMGYGTDAVEVQVGVHNLLDRDYFTHRAKGYSGPGIVPAPPRNYYITLSFYI